MYHHENDMPRNQKIQKINHGLPTPYKNPKKKFHSIPTRIPLMGVIQKTAFSYCFYQPGGDFL